MIYKLAGIVDSVEEDHLIINVGGVGYGVFCSSILLNKFSQIGKEISLYIETYVREDQLKLFGFADNIEKKTFNIITKIPGVGAKMGITILSAMTPSEISNAVMSEDKNSFKAVSGVGPKLATRIITELKGKILKNTDIIANSNVSVGSLGSNDESDINDAILALENFGFLRRDIYSLMLNLKKDNPQMKLDEMIKEGLKRLGSK